MQENKDRNTELYEKKKQGITYRELSLEYGLAIETIRRIVDRVKIKKILEKHNLNLDQELANI